MSLLPTTRWIPYHVVYSLQPTSDFPHPLYSLLTSHNGSNHFESFAQMPSCVPQIDNPLMSIRDHPLHPHIIAMDRFTHWMTPYGIDQIKTLLLLFPPSLVAGSHLLLCNSVVPGTLSNYAYLDSQTFVMSSTSQNCYALVLGKFGPRPIGTRSGPDQTLRSRSRSGIFPKIPDRSVSGLGILKLRETVSDPVWTRTA